jgi:hypothetical protein
MRIKGLLHTNLICVNCVSLLLAAVVLVSCQQDELDKNLVTLYPVVERNIETTVQTRALTGYSSYNTGANRQTIYAYAANGTDETLTGYFSPSTAAAGGWRSTLKAEADKSYYVYTHTALPGATIINFNFSIQNNVDIASLSFSGLSVISNTDPLVGTASAGAFIEAGATDQYPELTEGNYYIGEVITPANNKSTKVFLALKHLYAKATLRFKVDATYNELRTIKVKQVTVSTTAGGTLPGTHRYNFKNGELKTAENTQVSNATQSTLDILRGASSTVTFDDEEKTAVTLQADDYHEFGWLTFLPATYLGGNPNLSITVTYDVYDKSDPAVLLRENQTATNSNILRKLASGGVAGNNYQINITVNPTYLIVLSDTDVSEGLEIVIN